MPTFLHSWFRLPTETGSNCGTSPLLCASSVTQPCHPGVWLIWHTQYKHVRLDKAHFPRCSFAPRPQTIPKARYCSHPFGCFERRQPLFPFSTVVHITDAWNLSALSTGGHTDGNKQKSFLKGELNWTLDAEKELKHVTSFTRGSRFC